MPNINDNRRHEISSTSIHHRYKLRTHLNDKLIDTLNRNSRPNDVKLMILKDEFDPLSLQSNNKDIKCEQEHKSIKQLERNDLLRVINDFYRHDDVKKLATDRGLDLQLFKNAYVSFRKFLIQSTV
ncbi:unnamed protein product, partial [Rotaria magnacalcarata]